MNFIFPPHLTSASALTGETENPEIASFHLNTACFLTTKHETQLKTQMKKRLPKIKKKLKKLTKREKNKKTFVNVE